MVEPACRYMRPSARVYVGQRQLWAEIDSYLNGPDDEKRPCTTALLTGPAGCGKTAALANWVLRNRADGFVLPHFVGCNAQSRDSFFTLQRLLMELKRGFTLDGELPSTTVEMAQILPSWLERAALRARVIIIIDGVDELTEDSPEQDEPDVAVALLKLVQPT